VETRFYFFLLASAAKEFNEINIFPLEQKGVKKLFNTSSFGGRGRGHTVIHI